jgi:hypothetical protein
MKAVSFLLVAVTLLAQAPDSASRLSEDERSVYRLFLESKRFSGYRLEPQPDRWWDATREILQDCLQGLNLEARESPSTRFDESLIKGLSLTLTEKRNSALKLSEIAFDRGHRYAALRYSFSCGFDCAESATVVFEKTNGTWHQIDHRCSMVVA